MRRSPFIDVRFISPDVAAGSQMWLACPIWVGMMSTSTENSPPLRIASMIAATIRGRSPHGTADMASFTRSVRFL